jgi:hypothetical protein
MKLTQNQLEHLQDLMQRGVITADQANVEKVKMARVMIVSHLPAIVRKPLNNAVKNGELGHMKKEGKKPEAYFHPDFDYLARSERSKKERESIKATLSVCS